MLRISILGIFLLVTSMTATAQAGIGGCLRAFSEFEQHKQSLVDVKEACMRDALRGDKTSTRIMGTAYFIAGDYAHAESWLMRAAHQGEVSSPFLLAAVFNSYGKTEMAATWAYRGQKRMNMLRAASRTGSVRYLDKVEADLHRMIRVDLSALARQGETVALASVGDANPFVGKWKIGPYGSCNHSFAQITAQDAAFYFGSREDPYDSIRFNLKRMEATLVNSAGSMTFRLLDRNTLQLIRVVDRMTKKSQYGGIIATRCT